jgi:hypothetical protein
MRLALAVTAMLGGPALAQELGAAALERVRVRSTVQPLGPAPFGESINLYTGSLSFTHLDVDYPGTGPAIQLTRSFDTQTRFVQSYKFFGDWTFDIPRIETIVRRPIGGLGTPGGNWTVSPSGSSARCSQLDQPYELDQSQYLWWHGYDLIVPGARKTLLRAAAGLQMPSISIGGTAVTFKGTTADNWRIGCLATTSNGQSGEGFLAVDPEGTKYYLDYLIGKDAGQVLEFDGGTTIRHPIMVASMMVSRIEDRFGNYLTFSYSGSRLTQIAASDGRVVSIAWRPETADLVASITVQPAGSRPRTTTYEYTTINSLPVLTGVVLPDSSRWTFSNLVTRIGLFSPIGCGQRAFNPATPASTPPTTATLTHPSGLVGAFTLSNTYHGKSYVPGACDTYPSAHEANHPVFSTFSLTSKQLSGPGLAARTWTYTYAPVQASASYDSCAASNTCPDTKWVDVVAPDGVRTRYTFSNRYTELEGKELSTAVYPAGSSTPIQTTAKAYASPTAGPYPVSIGTTLLDGNSNYLLEQSIAPLRSNITTQDGTAFTWRVAPGCGGYAYCFDGFGRVTQMIKSSAPTP